MRLLVSVLAACLAGCSLAPGASVPSQTSLTFLTAVPPAAALDSVAAWVPTVEDLEMVPVDDGLAIRDRRPGRDNVATVTARRRDDALTEVTVQSRYVIRASGFRDLSSAVYFGQVPRGTAPLALPVDGGPPCFTMADRDASPRSTADSLDAESLSETPPTLIGGLEGLQRRVAYPESARRAGIQGQVVSEFIVGPAGTVECAQVIASPHAELTAAALDAVRTSTFTPGLLDGQPVRVRFALPISFRLR